MKNFELTDEYKIIENGVKVYRIKCVKDFKNITAGSFGGWIENSVHGDNPYGKEYRAIIEVIKIKFKL